jgi:hypothetical protein
MTRDTKVSRSGDILFAQVGPDEAVVLSVEQGCYYGLNAVAARICELIDTPVTIAQLSARICEEFEIDAQTAEAEVVKFVNTLAANGIVREEA